jgi:ABC-type branched-subunit amino acid transport system ATPase component
VTPVLETRALRKEFAGFMAIDGVSLRLAAGMRQALIGPNGAGKTTLVNLLTGSLAASGGQVLLDGRDITGLPTHRRVRLGLTRTFQISQLFGSLTPLQSVALAVCEREGLTRNAWRGLDGYRSVTQEALSRLRELRLADVAGERTEDLPYGKQRLLELALALTARPRVLLLDEPAAGVPHGETGEILDALARLPRAVTILLIEHDMDLVFRFAEKIAVLVGGSLLVEGEPAAVARDPQVRQVYLGESVGT